MRERTELENRAHESAKAWFKSRNVPHWTTEYQTTYPIYVGAFIRAAKRQEKKNAREARG
jgi:hypothetical protein